MPHKIRGDLVQPVAGSDDFVVFSEQFFEQRLFIGTCDAYLIAIDARTEIGDVVIVRNAASRAGRSCVAVHAMDVFSV